MKRIISITCLLLGLWVTAQAEPQTWENVPCGETVTISATPATGYEFLQWSDGSTENPHTVSIFQGETLTAYFQKTTPTAVDNVDAQTSTPRKMLINDKLYILLDDKLYDATGKRVK